MKADKPIISVIVPVYNVEKYIHKCIDSILAQDFQETEIIIVDDGSTDSSGSIVDEYANQFPEKIIVLHQENCGQGEARNKGIEIARGDYIIFVDSDDYLEKNALTILFNEINDSNSEIAVCGIRRVDEMGNYLSSEIDTGFPLHTCINIKECKGVVAISPSPCNKLIKKTLFTENRITFPSKVWYEDFRTIPKVLAFAKTISFTDECLYNYFQRPGSTMRNSNTERNHEIIDAMEDLMSFFKSKNLLDVYASELEFMAIRSVLWDSTVRILKNTRKHPVLKDIRTYTLQNFPNAFANKYFVDFINEKKLIRSILLFCLKNRFYWALYLILKIKG